MFRLKKNRRITQWQKQLNLPAHQQVFNSLFQAIDGFALSRQARIKQDAMDYVYGEIEFLPFIALLSLVKPNEETVFYDLGSGTGKAVIACALVYPVKKCVGIELLPELHASTQQHGKQLAALKDYLLPAKQIEFILGDFLEVDFNDATLIFINSTSIVGLTWEHLCLRINKLTSIATVITTSKPLLSSNYTVISSTPIQMSWGVVLAYIHTRKTNLN